MPRTLKDSGIPWVGKIPADWDMHPLYYYFGERNRPNRLGKNNNLLSLSYGKIIKKDINTNEGLLPASYNSYNIIEPLDIVLRLTDLQNDKRSLRTGLSFERGIITSAYVTLKPVKQVSSVFFHYLLHAYDVSKVLYNMGNGVRQSLNYDELSKLPLIEPPLAEQKKIADFLDKKCGEVDALAHNIQQQIDTLEQYKRAIITETVTKGLNPSAPMKDSGIPWIGQIPEHWAQCKIKNICTLIGSGTTPDSSISMFYDEGTINWIQSGDVYGKSFITNVTTLISQVAFKSSPALKIYSAPFIVIAMYGGSVGNTAISMINACTNQACCCLKPNPNTDLKFLFYWINFCKEDFLLRAEGGGQPNISQNKIKNQFFCAPPFKEQQAIASYLDDKCGKIDSLIKTKQEQLAKLEEYKKAIIFEYVTGKKPVPEEER